jgi:serine-type D-Ala-D-Ala endopeptidase (penicillin-binding protein 7)
MRLTGIVTATLLLGITSLPAAADDAPTLKSEVAVVLDARTGAEVYAKDADDVHAIASTSKIFVAMAVRRKGLVLDDWTEITQADVKAARGGARTRLDRGQTFSNHDLLRAMLMASDNRAPSALGRAVGLDRQGMIDEMNAVAKDLGLKKTKFTDVSGLRGNVSTAREMALAMRAAIEDPVIAEIMTTSWVRITSKSGYAKLDYGNTNAVLQAGKYKITGGKTGYTKSAGYCFVAGTEIEGNEYVMAFLGAEGKSTRFADFNRVATWITEGGAGATVKVAARTEDKARRQAKKQKAKLRVSAKGKVKKK